jgi:hypothetical protein
MAALPPGSENSSRDSDKSKASSVVLDARLLPLSSASFSRARPTASFGPKGLTLPVFSTRTSCVSEKLPVRKSSLALDVAFIRPTL